MTWELGAQLSHDAFILRDEQEAALSVRPSLLVHVGFCISVDLARSWKFAQFVQTAWV